MALIEKEKLIAEYDRVHVGPPGGARKLMEDADLVEAIPVPWIESYLSDCAEMSIAYYVIKQMLYKWREEQEGE